MKYSYNQNKILVISSMASGTISLVSSGTLIVMILRSELKLGAPSRRVFFFLCAYDCIYSVASAQSSIPVPETDKLWASFGNIQSCKLQGFLVHIGFLGSILYNCSLSIYYLCIIKFGMTDVKFRNTIEPICHALSNLFPIVSAIYLLLGNHFNSIGQLCWVGPFPPTCIIDPNVECQRGGKVYASRAFFWTMYIVFGFMVVNMCLIVWTVVAQKRNSDRWGSGGMGGDIKTMNLDNHSIAIREIEIHNEMIEPRNCKVENELGYSGDSPRLETSGDEIGVQNLGTESLHSKESSVYPRAMWEKTERKSPIRSPKSIETSKSKKKERKSGNDPLAFNLKAMRAKTKGESLIKGSERIYNKSASDSKYDVDGNPEHGLGNFETRSDKDCIMRASDLKTRSKKFSSNGSSNVIVETSIHAILYILAFILTWVFLLATRILLQRGRTVPFYLHALARIFNPLQGLFNILVYCRLRVISLRRSSGYAWLVAFWLTIKGGGDNNMAGNGRSGPKNEHERNRLQQRIRLEHLERMQQIREERDGEALRQSGLRSLVLSNSLRSHVSVYGNNAV